MKKITFLLLGVLMMTSVNAEENEYVPLVREGVKWVYLFYEQTHNIKKVYPSYLYSLEINGDSLVQINGKNYKKVYYTLLDRDFQPVCEPELVSLVREEDGVVYRRLLREYPYNADNQPICQPFWVNNMMEYAIYDFNRDSYLPELPYYSDEFYSIANEYFRNNPYQTTVMVGDGERDAYVMNDSFDIDISFFLECKVIEGIGADNRSGNLLAPQLDYYTAWNKLPGLAAVFENGELVYQGALYDDAIKFSNNESEAPHQYVPIVREGVKWEYVSYNSYIGIKPGMADIYTLEFNGENEKGHLLYRTDYDAQGNAMEPHLIAYVKEDDKDVTVEDVENPGYRNIYDFNQEQFLPYEAFSFDPFDYSYNKRIILEVNNTERLGFDFNYDINDGNYISLYEVKIIEGIGVDCKYGDLINPFIYFITGVKPYTQDEDTSNVPDVSAGQIFSGLSAVYEDGELVYKGCLYDEAQLLKEPDAITTIAGDKQVKSVHYYNLAGMESAEPQQGVNIKVTTYSDGSRQSEKILR